MKKGGIFMIITGSKVNLASSHRYEKSVTHTSHTLGFGGAYAGIAAQRSFTSSTYLRQQFYASASTGTRDFYLPNQLGVNDDMAAASTYTRYGRFSDSRVGERSQDNRMNTDRIQNNAVLSGTTDWFGALRRETFHSILDLLHRLRFRGMFDGSPVYRQTADRQQMQRNTDAAPANAQKTQTDDASKDRLTGTPPSSSTLTLSNGVTLMTWRISQRYATYTEEAESTAFSGEGTAVTADGRTIPFNVAFELSRSYMEYSELTYVSQYTTVLTDPLVINLSDSPAQVTDQTFYFDLDGDGKEEEIAQLGAGSGYLALDKNNDGIINDGTELFGTASGDGFKDLSAYDSDGSGWIDEADEIYSQLKIWTKDADGKDVLLSLKEADVGAIYLGSTQTPFAVTDENNQIDGMVRRSGVYLHENGAAGTVQQIDF